MKKSILSLALFVAFSVHATSPRIIPGQAKSLDEKSVELLDAMSRNPEDFVELMRSGNKITDATVQFVKPGVTNFRITAEECGAAFGPHPGCRGGAILSITKTTRNSRPAHYEYESKITKLRE